MHFEQSFDQKKITWWSLRSIIGDKRFYHMKKSAMKGRSVSRVEGQRGDRGPILGRIPTLKASGLNKGFVQAPDS
jgi:hypothetical protein